MNRKNHKYRSIVLVAILLATTLTAGCATQTLKNDKPLKAANLCDESKTVAIDQATLDNLAKNDENCEEWQAAKAAASSDSMSPLLQLGIYAIGYTLGFALAASL